LKWPRKTVKVDYTRIVEKRESAGRGGKLLGEEKLKVFLFSTNIIDVYVSLKIKGESKRGKGF